MKAIRLVSASRKLDPDAGLALTIERSLVAAELREAGLSELIAVPDARSSEVRHIRGIWAANSSYLNHLLGHCPAPRGSRPMDSPRVPLPIRLIDRLGGVELNLGTSPELEVDASVRWEIAALAAGKTMGEWAFGTIALKVAGNRVKQP